MQLPVPTPALSLRRAGPADAPAIAECVDAAYASWVAVIGRKPWPMVQDYAGLVQTEYVVVAEDGAEVVGVLVLSDGPEGFLLDNVAVRPARKGQGIGKALLVHAEDVARSRGHGSLHLYTNEKMAENITLCEKIGYVEYERRREEGFCRVFMRKKLS